MGDLVYSLLFCKILGTERVYVDGGEGTVKFNWNSADFILPLLQSQNYVEILPYDNQEFDIDYGIHPENIRVEAGYNLVSYHASKFDISFDDYGVNKPWLSLDTVDDSYIKSKKVLINRTHRYRGNDTFYYDFLKYYKPSELVFCGIDEEYDSFCSDFNANIDFLKTENSLELATLINSVPVFVGNQSLICAIAQGLGKTCYIETGRLEHFCFQYFQYFQFLLLLSIFCLRR